MAIHIEVLAIQSREEFKMGVRASEFALEVCEDGNFQEIFIRRLKQNNVENHYEIMCSIMDHDDNHLNSMFEDGEWLVYIDGNEVDEELLERVYKEYGILEDELDDED